MASSQHHNRDKKTILVSVQGHTFCSLNYVLKNYKLQRIAKHEQRLQYNYVNHKLTIKTVKMFFVILIEWSNMNTSTSIYYTHSLINDCVTNKQTQKEK